MKKRVDSKRRQRVSGIVLAALVTASLGVSALGVSAAGGQVVLNPSSSSEDRVGYSQININNPRHGEITVSVEGEDVRDGDWVKDGKRVSVYVKADTGYFVHEIRVSGHTTTDSNRIRFTVNTDDRKSYTISASIYDRDDRDDYYDDDYDYYYDRYYDRYYYDDDYYRYRWDTKRISALREDTRANANKGIVTAANPSDATARIATETVLTKTKSSDQAKVVFRNSKTIQNSVLRTVYSTADGRDVMICADSLDGGRLIGRLYIDPSKASDTAVIVRPGIETSSELCKQVRSSFARGYTNKNLAVVRFDQQGSFGVSMEAAVDLKLTGFDTDNLYFYSYDSSTNRYSRLTTEYRIDSNGYLHFDVTDGNYVVITDKALSK